MQLEKVEEQFKNALEVFVTTGNMGLLNQEQQAFIIAKLCEKYGLEPVMRPFEILTFQGIKRLYLTKSGCDQIANVRGLSRKIISEYYDNDKKILKVVAEVTDGKRTEVGVACLNMAKYVQNPQTKKVEKVELEGDEFCNAVMKAYSKAIRRATLAFVGFPFEDDLPTEQKIEVLHEKFDEKLEIQTEKRRGRPRKVELIELAAAEEKPVEKHEEKYEEKPIEKPVEKPIEIKEENENDEEKIELANIEHKKYLIEIIEKHFPDLKEWRSNEALKAKVVKLCVRCEGQVKNEEKLVSHMKNLLTDL